MIRNRININYTTTRNFLTILFLLAFNNLNIMSLNNNDTIKPISNIGEYNLPIDSLDYSKILQEKRIQKSDYLICTLDGDMPIYPGGNDELQNFIKLNLRYPKDFEGCIEGCVIIQFAISKDGSISDIKILRSLHPLLDEEAIRVVKLMPKWIPGVSQKEPFVFTLPLKFKLV